jgi:DNA-binding transcriptional ArsR family regulator
VRTDPPEPRAERVGLFCRTAFRISEEDRVTNALMITLQHATTPLAADFIRQLGCTIEDSWPIQIREHFRYDKESVVDAEMRVVNRLVVAVENKIYRHQFDDLDQVKRYLKLLSRMKEERRILLLISPDEKAPPATRILGQSEACFIRWLRWAEVHAWFRRRIDSIAAEDVLDRYLASEFLSYLEYLGLSRDSRRDKRRPVYEPKLDGVLATPTIERILMYLVHFGSVYGSQVSRDQGIALCAVQLQLKNLERRGILRRRLVGKTVVFTLDERYPYLQPLLGLARAAYEAMAPAERRAMFGE